MDRNDSFSKRFGFKPETKEIITRNEASQGLREYVIQTLYSLDFQPSQVREVICRVLKIMPDRNNWSERPNIDYEVRELIAECEWYKVYDIIESFSRSLQGEMQKHFESEINDYFLISGIGWKLIEGQIEMRGDEHFETAIAKVEDVLEAAQFRTAKTEIKEAINDLSRRPAPDVTGAIQHSFASLEIVYREVTGDRKATLGELAKKYTDVLPKPLHEAVTKIWGYASEQGRHLREGQEPDLIEAELIVELSAALTTYLSKKLLGTKGQSTAMANADDLSF